MSDQINKNTKLCDPGNSCLVVIDIQDRLTEAMPVKVVIRLKKNSAMLIKAAKILSIPVFVTKQYPKGLGPLVPEIEEVLPENAQYFEKTCFSCADADNFTSQLSITGRRQIILAGVEAHICVLQTAIDLSASGYEVYVVADAVCSRHRENYENALQRMRHSGIIECNTESVLFEWLKDARHEHFKTVSAMIR
jgi:nicotinamidase-related amidase